MRKNFTLRSLTASVMMILTATAVNAQDADNPWHLIVMNEDSIELAAFNVEALTGVTVSGENVEIDMTWEGRQKSYAYPVSSIFTFDPRANGAGTPNGEITVPQWTVTYGHGMLNFSEPVSNVAVYAISGALVTGNTGNHTAIPVNLSPGLYVVQAGSHSAKLLVGSGGTGGGAFEKAQTKPVATATNDPPPTLRAGSSIKIYWNIKAGDNITVVEIADVVSFRFTADNSIIFTLKNGNTIEMTDYQGIEFTIEPAPPTITSNWDLEKTLKFGGVSYTWRGPSLIGKSITFVIIHKNGIKFHIEQSFSPNQVDQKFNMAEINQKVWDVGTQYNGKLSVFGGSDYYYGMSYIDNRYGNRYIDMATVTGENAAVGAADFSFNNNTNIIPTAIIQNSNGSITMNCTDYMGVVHSYTFTGW